MEHPDQVDLVEWIEKAPPPEPPSTPTGNGGPPLDEAPSYEALAKIGRAIHGKLWEGKVAEDLGEDPRTLRRWRAGQGAPSARTMGTARAWAMETAAAALSAAGEEDLAGSVLAKLATIKAAARERGAALMGLSQKGDGGAN